MQWASFFQWTHDGVLGSPLVWYPSLCEPFVKYHLNVKWERQSWGPEFNSPFTNTNRINTFKSFPDTLTQVMFRLDGVVKIWIVLMCLEVLCFCLDWILTQKSKRLHWHLPWKNLTFKNLKVFFAFARICKTPKVWSEPCRLVHFSRNLVLQEYYYINLDNYHEIEAMTRTRLCNCTSSITIFFI